MRHSRAQVGGHLGGSPVRGGRGGRGAPESRPVGAITRGTTAANRLRRADRWMAHRTEFRRLLTATDRPLVVDLGYGASHTTTVEWARRLRPVAPGVRVVGLEIDPARVLEPVDGVEFRLGGFELAGLRPTIVRAFNVLRQYREDEVADTWAMITGAMAPGGLLLEGTCDELGRRCSWVVVDDEGPRTLTLCWSPAHAESPSDVAERLPKALIHRNVPGERVHDLLTAADEAWGAAAPYAAFGPRERWRRAHAQLRSSGVPAEPLRSGTRDAVLTVPWSAVAPA